MKKIHFFAFKLNKLIENVIFYSILSFVLIALIIGCVNRTIDHFGLSQKNNTEFVAAANEKETPEAKAIANLQKRMEKLEKDNQSLKTENRILEDKIKKLESERPIEVYEFDDYIRNEESLIGILENARRSNIYVKRHYISSSGWETGRGTGSGLIFYKSKTHYYILTNEHVITDNERDGKYEHICKIETYSLTEYDCEVIKQGKIESMKDMAVIRIPIKENLPVTPIDFNYKVKPGELLFSIGNPGNVRNNVIPTYYAGIRKNGSIITKFKSNNFGNSGGAIINQDGKLVGIMTWQQGTDEDENPDGVVVEHYGIGIKDIEAFISEFLDD